MPKLEYSPLVLEDLQNIRSFIIDNWGEDAAWRILCFYYEQHRQQ
ncbi:MAG TPA: type II toxin-antitoxin system RelE/ParE family toxin [Clostridiales bacterium]|nr:type II toxin-antitoxin system RelE/ParE family toxin [Clostridiales bacterium]